MIRTSYRLTLTCDTCPATGAETTFDGGGPVHYAAGYLAAVRRLRLAAQYLGWTFGGFHRTDFCPVCSIPRRKEIANDARD